MVNPARRSARRRAAQAIALATLCAVGSATAIVPAYADTADDKVAQAQANEKAAADSVAGIESQLAQVEERAQSARADAETAENNYNAAMSNLVVAQRDVKDAEAALSVANDRVDKARAQLRHLVQAVYTTGGGSLSSIAPYLTKDGLDAVEIRKIAVDVLGDRYDAQLREFEDAQSVAASKAQAAKTALAREEQIAQRAKAAKDESDAVAQQVESTLTTLTGQRDDLIAKLADARGVSLEAEKERQAEIDREAAEREKAAEQAAIEAVKKAAAEAQAKAEAEAQAKAEAAAKAEAQAKAEAAAKEKAAAEAKAKAEADARAKAEAAAKAKAAAEAKAKAEAAAKAKAEADAAAKATQTPAPPAPKPAPKPTPTTQAPSIPDLSASDRGAEVAAYALRFVGVPYVWGGSSPSGFDCSGLVQYAFRNAIGLTLPRVSWDQGARGYAISQSQARIGDLVYYGGHVGIYLGNGKMIHAPKPGDVVKVAPVYGNPQYRRIIG